ncbi:TRAP transporter small permease [Hoeflea sp. CAU 1731]
MNRIGRWATQAGQWLAVAALVAMMVHLGADILLRNIAARPLDGTLEVVAGLYMPFVVFAALSATHLNREEIRVDLVGNFLPQTAVMLLDRAAQLLMAICAAALAWLTASHAMRAFDIGQRIEAGSLVIPLWPGKAIVTTGFVLLAVAALVRLFGKADNGSV